MKVDNLSRVVTFLPKSKIKAGEAKENGKYVFFTSSDSRHLYIDEYLYDDELIVLGTGGLPSCNYYNGKFAVSTDNFVIKTNNNLLPKYLYYFLRKDNLSMLRNGFRGTGLKHISKDYVSNIQIPIIDLKDQKTMVGVLDKLNSSIEGEKQLIVCYDKLIKSRFNEMFLSKSFETIKIRSLVDLNKQSAKKNYKLDEEFEYIDISSIYNKTNTIISSTRYALKNAPSRAQQCLKNNDILVSTVRPNLKNVALYQGNDYGYVGSSGFCVLRAKKCNPYYLMYNIISDDFTDSMVKLTTGASYPAIRDDDVLDYQIINAPLDLQNEFASFINQIDKLKFNCQQRIKLYQELLDKKMDEYFG